MKATFTSVRSYSILLSSSSSSLKRTMASVSDRLSSAFHEKLAPLVHCEILNESYMHSVPKDSETHFKVILVSSQFAGLMPVKRHRMVYQVADSEIRPPTMSPSDVNYFHKIHALSIIAKTPEEWEQVKDTVSRKSPSCMGGEKVKRTEA
jgi:stress-induced morphogen